MTIYALWQLYAADDIKKEIDKSLRTRDTDAQRFDKRRKITWEILDGVMNNDPRSMDVFYRVISDYLTYKARAQLKTWGRSQHQSDVPDFVNGFLVDKVLTRSNSFWNHFMNNSAVQRAREKGEDTVPFASAITVPFVRYMHDIVFRRKENQQTDSMEDWLDITDPLNNPFTHMNRTQQERRLHKELIRLFTQFMRSKSPKTSVRALEPLMYEVLFEENAHGDTKRMVNEFVRSNDGIRTWVENKGGDIDTDIAKWAAKFYRDLRNAISEFYSFLKTKLDPSFAQLATVAFVRRVAMDTLKDMRTIAEFGRVAKWMPPSSYAQYDYKPTYDDVRSQAYMQVDLAVSYAAVVYETLRYMRSAGFDKKLVSEKDFYEFADQAGFPLKQGRIPRNYLAHLIHKYRHLFHPALDLDHPENFTAMASYKTPVPLPKNAGRSTTQLRLARRLPQGSQTSMHQ